MESNSLKCCFSVSVRDLDEVPPVIQIIGDEIIFHPTEKIYSDLGAEWNDDVDGSGDLVADGTVNIDVPGTYHLVYRFSDLAGNEAETKTRKGSGGGRIASDDCPSRSKR